MLSSGYTASRGAVMMSGAITLNPNPNPAAGAVPAGAPAGQPDPVAQGAAPGQRQPDALRRALHGVRRTGRRPCRGDGPLTRLEPSWPGAFLRR